MNRRVCSSSSDSRVEATREVLSAGSSAPDDLMVRWSIALEQLCQWSCAVEGNG
jgi:ABC-type phosphate transport system substrate-binding protein